MDGVNNGGCGAKPAVLFRACGGIWKPDLRFDVHFLNQTKVRFVNGLFEKYCHWIVAFNGYQHHPVVFSLELQFGDTQQEREKLLECRKEYRSAYPICGRRKPTFADLFRK
jgi:hypothetical protein